MKLTNIQTQKLQLLQVALVYLFGSYAEQKQSVMSDVDIGIVFSPGKFPKNISEVYNELYFILSDIFKGKNIDIIFLQRANLELKYDVVRHGKILFCSSANRQSNFEDETTMLYMDFKPLLNEFNRNILQRINGNTQKPVRTTTH